MESLIFIFQLFLNPSNIHYVFLFNLIIKEI